MLFKMPVDEIKAYHTLTLQWQGAPFENILNVIKRWVLQEVGTDENGRTNECLVVYDYLKLMSSLLYLIIFKSIKLLVFRLPTYITCC